MVDEVDDAGMRISVSQVERAIRPSGSNCQIDSKKRKREKEKKRKRERKS
jgi:hypothetical protein